MKRIKLKDYLSRMEAAVASLMAEDRFKNYLRSLALFRRYSFANRLLIYIQKPDATSVAGIKVWNELGRRVKKGQNGIMIFAPTFRSLRNKKPRNDITESEEDEAAVKNKEPHSVLSGFRAVYVFDISQTDGQEITLAEFQARPQFSVSEGTGVKDLFQRILAVCPLPVEYAHIPYKGCYEPFDHRIKLSTALTDLEKPKTLIHEIAHSMALDTKEHTLNERSMAEVIAEGAAFVVCNHYGLDTSSYSFAYIAAWGQEIKKILSWGDAVMRISNRLIDLIGDAEIEQRHAA